MLGLMPSKHDEPIVDEGLDLDYDELDRRMDAVRRGLAIVIPWEEARRELLPERGDFSAAQRRPEEQRRT